jgi:hypothetical protein
VDERTTYVLEQEITDRNDAATACVAVLEVLRPVLRVALVDAYSDYEDQMPPDVAEAQQWLRQEGASQQGGDPGMSVEMNSLDADHWPIICRYAPWSIHVDLYGDGDAPLATLHDCGYSVTADLTPAEATALGSRLAGVSGLTLLHQVRERRRQNADNAGRR